MTNDYHFLTRWRVQGTAGEVYAILSEPLDYPRWWPSVYLDVDQLTRGDADGTGRRLRLHTRGWLPYTLHWECETLTAEPPACIEIAATGDLEGRGIWSIVSDGKFADVTFDWKLRAQKPILRRLSFALKPAFEANHRWAMKQGEIALDLELKRNRATTPEEMNAIPKPPQPAQITEEVLVAGAILASGVVMAIASGGDTTTGTKSKPKL